jgi:hypothetical protein
MPFSTHPRSGMIKTVHVCSFTFIPPRTFDRLPQKWTCWLVAACCNPPCVLWWLTGVHCILTVKALYSYSKSLFDSVVTGAFQITFRVKIHTNNIFLFFKNYFWHQHIKTIQNVQTILNFRKKKFQIFWERRLNRVPKRSLKAKGK